MGMCSSTDQHLDTAMPINHLCYPRTELPIELLVVFSNGSYNLFETFLLEYKKEYREE